MATRILSAIIGISIGILILIASNTIVLYLAMAFVCSVAVYEMLKAGKCLAYRFSFAVCLGYAVLYPFFYLPAMRPWQTAFTVLGVILLFCSYLKQHQSLRFEQLAFMAMALVFVPWGICCLITLKQLDTVHGTFYIVLTLMAAWVADAGAYFVGTLFGKHKLCPLISPKKTVEGAVGGLIFSVLVLCLTCWIYQELQFRFDIIFEVRYGMVVIIGLISAVLAMLGDMAASLLKRQCQIKDYGNLIPGHGGILDRFDSVLFVAPFLSIFLSFFPLFY